MLIKHGLRGIRRTVVAVAVAVTAMTAVTMPGTAAVTTAGPTFFKDVLHGQAFFTEVMWMSAKGISTGWSDGTFRPLASTNRDAMAAFLYRLAGSPAFAAPEQPPFRDVAPTSAFAREIAWAGTQKIIAGYADGTYRPVAPMTRAEMAMAIYRFKGAPAYLPPTVSPFVDVPPTSAQYREISWMYATGLSTGWVIAGRRYYRPAAAIERQAMAAFFYRMSGSPAFVPAQDGRPPSVEEIPDWQWFQMLAAGVWRAGCPLSRKNFVRIEVPFYGFDKRAHRGVVVMNRDVARDTVAVFATMYAKRFPIYSVIPLEYFHGSDVASEIANNSSGMNCRQPWENASPSPSADAHANGRGFDFNPVQNPWIRPGTSVWEPSSGSIWASRRTLAWEPVGVVAAYGIPWTWFRQAGGWRWGLYSTVDYMHFDTGYPSVYKAGH